MLCMKSSWSSCNIWFCTSAWWRWALVSCLRRSTSLSYLSIWSAICSLEIRSQRIRQNKSMLHENDECITSQNVCLVCRSTSWIRGASCNDGSAIFCSKNGHIYEQFHPIRTHCLGAVRIWRDYIEPWSSLSAPGYFGHGDSRWSSEPGGGFKIYTRGGSPQLQYHDCSGTASRVTPQGHHRCKRNRH